MKIADQIRRTIKDAVKTESVEVMIEANLRLAGYICYLAEEETKAYRTKVLAHERVKVTEAEFFLVHDGTAAHKERESLVHSKPLREASIEADVIHYGLQNLRRTATQFVDVLKQKIANARKERELTSVQP